MGMFRGNFLGQLSPIKLNLNTQVEQLEQHGIERLYKEKASGADAKRPELAALLDYVREGDTVVVTKIDRIARSTKHLLEVVETLERKKVTFRVLNINLDSSTPTGRLMVVMLAAIATFERELMLERQRDGIERAKLAGRYKGRAPTARWRQAEIIDLASQGLTRQAIASRLGIGIASVYRVMKDYKEQSTRS